MDNNIETLDLLLEVAQNSVTTIQTALQVWFNNFENKPKEERIQDLIAMIATIQATSETLRFYAQNP